MVDKHGLPGESYIENVRQPTLVIRECHPSSSSTFRLRKGPGYQWYLKNAIRILLLPAPCSHGPG